MGPVSAWPAAVPVTTIVIHLEAQTCEVSMEYAAFAHYVCMYNQSDILCPLPQPTKWITGSYIYDYGLVLVWWARPSLTWITWWVWVSKHEGGSSTIYTVSFELTNQVPLTKFQIVI